jgi:hypothetical protein
MTETTRTIIYGIMVMAACITVILVGSAAFTAMVVR